MLGITNKETTAVEHGQDRYPGLQNNEGAGYELQEMNARPENNNHARLNADPELTAALLLNQVLDSQV